MDQVFWLLLLIAPAASQQVLSLSSPLNSSVVLPCRAPTDDSIVFLECSRPDQVKEGYLLLFRGGRFENETQLPAYKGRVELRDGGMKDGDVSLTLKNVSEEDQGRYRYVIIQRGRGGEKITTTSYINLTVTDGVSEKISEEKKEEKKEEDGGMSLLDRGLVGGVVVAVPLLTAVGLGVFLWIIKKKLWSPVEPGEVKTLIGPAEPVNEGGMEGPVEPVELRGPAEPVNEGGMEEDGGTSRTSRTRPDGVQHEVLVQMTPLTMTSPGSPSLIGGGGGAS